MKILFIVHNYLPKHLGGTEFYTAQVAAELGRKGHNITIVTRESGYSAQKLYVDHGTHLGIRTFRIYHNARGIYKKRLPAFFRSFRNSLIRRTILGIVSSERPDVVHIQHLRDLDVGLIPRLRRMGLPVIVTLHDYWALCPRNTLLTNSGDLCADPSGISCLNACLEPAIGAKPGPATAILGRRVMRHRRNYIFRNLGRANLLLSPSAYLIDRFRHAGFDTDRVLHITNGISFAGNGVPRESPNVRDPSASGFVFAFFGNVLPHKGVHLLIEAFSSLQDDRFRLHIHGDLKADPDYALALRNLTRDGRIRFFGRYDNAELSRLYTRTHCIVLPSLWEENCPLVLLEAFSAGVPVIACDVGGARELIEEYNGGVLFERGNVDSLREKMLGMAERVRAGERFQIKRPKGLDEHVAELVRLYETETLGAARSPNLTSRTVGDGLVRQGGDPTAHKTWKMRICVIVTARRFDPAVSGLVDRIRRQGLPPGTSLEIVIVCSEASGPGLVSGANGIKFVNLSGGTFNHGSVRNLGLRQTDADYAVHIVADAIPADEHWLARLVRPLHEDPQVAAVYSRQKPIPDSSVITRIRIEEHFARIEAPEHGREQACVVKQLPDKTAYQRMSPEERMRLAEFDHVSAAVRTSVWKKHPYRELPFGEDIEWALRVLLDGYKIVYEPNSIIYHSHDRGSLYILKRNYVGHKLLHELFGLVYVARLRHVVANVLRGTRALFPACRKESSLTRSLFLIPRMFLLCAAENLGQYLAVAYMKSGNPGVLRRRLDDLLSRGV